MPNREWGAKSNGKPPHLFIPSKTATLVPEFSLEDLPLSRTAVFDPEFAVKTCHGAEHFNNISSVICKEARVAIRPGFPGHVLFFQG